MSARQLKILLHPSFPDSGVAVIARRVAPVEWSGSTRLNDAPAPSELTGLDWMTPYGALLGAAHEDGQVEWLNPGSVNGFWGQDAQGHLLGFVIPASDQQPPLPALRFLCGEVIPFLLGLFDPSKGTQTQAAPPNGTPGWGKSPKKSLTSCEAILRTLWQCPALEKQVAMCLGVERLTTNDRWRLVGKIVDERTIRNYARKFEKERELARSEGYDG